MKFRIRALHIEAPDDYPDGPLFDVHVTLSDGTWGFSDACFNTEDEAGIYLAGVELRCRDEASLRDAAFSFVGDD